MIISVGSDGKLIIWSCNESVNVFNPEKWSQIYEQTSEGKESINTFDSLYINEDELYVAYFTSSSVASFFHFSLTNTEDSKIKIVSTFLTSTKTKWLIVSLTLAVLNESNLLVLYGGYDSLITVNSLQRLGKDKKERESTLCNHLVLRGHTNSIREISFNDKLNPQMIGTCSQDTYIRLWSLKKLTPNEVLIFGSRKKDNITVFDEYKSQTSFVFSLNENEMYHILLESVLSDHEEPVSSVKFFQREEKESQKTFILTSSFDFTVGLWEYINGIWQKTVTLGEMSGNKNSFYGAVFTEDENHLIGFNYTGALYYWVRENGQKQFKSLPIVHGHFQAVTDISWDPEGKYLLSCSSDQTTRLFSFNKSNWFELSRPQIHGYNLNSIAILQEPAIKDIDKGQVSERVLPKFVSASEEKIIRMFEPSYNTVKLLNEFSSANVRLSRDKPNEAFEKNLIEGDQQALGLTNKQMNVAEDDDMKFDITNFDPNAFISNQKNTLYNKSMNFAQPPDEDFLTNHTLWPEANKLYGHSYEVIIVAASHKGDVFASAGSAKTEKYSHLFIWNVKSNNVLQKLEGHALTIIQIEFSKDDNLILTVSRDRSWCLYKRNDKEDLYSLYQTAKECHLRIIWGCSFTDDSLFFATGSRDKFAKIWKNTDSKYSCVGEKEFDEAVTSVELLSSKNDPSKIILLAGLENGYIQMLRLLREKEDSNKYILSPLVSISQHVSFGGKVHRIKSSYRAEDDKV
eukprot:CAMPEP_0170527956 /NCGR_PEP_ID=MMETSP0209-20121228/13442_1 /TAXON_ID=665100 ORGANISM="Litonotus pictus, Strain P1" /NCGR_SAMPLE_ID=MMETSP0209 /ASSEMBLY_ACC=CAM_ASM_000301 /LENGTH=740 /DNA_ID=CAMNT_0010818857 /DNA_START=166 /DNA_END=2384 /DNA_ORIENTATION=-